MHNGKWFACELHCHTVHSDGDFTVQGLLQAARARKLDGICLTDHNTTAGWAEAQASKAPVVLPGIEWTTYFGHMPVLDCTGYVDWRDAQPNAIDEKLRQVQENGGICGVAHPFQLGTPICTGGYWDYAVQDWSLVQYIEIWSEGAPFLNPANRRAMALWESLLDRGFHLAPTFGRDWHRTAGNVYPAACTYLLCAQAPLTARQMKTAIQQGKTVVSAGPLLDWETEAGDTIGDCVTPGVHTVHFHVDLQRAATVPDANTYTPRQICVRTNGGETVLRIAVQGAGMTASLPMLSGWYRAELWGDIDGKPDCLLAATAPMYTTQAPASKAGTPRK